jgi:hypothetical protein
MSTAVISLGPTLLNLLLSALCTPATLITQQLFAAEIAGRITPYNLDFTFLLHTHLAQQRSRHLPRTKTKHFSRFPAF